MTRRNIQAHNAWNNLWHIFFPWVVGHACDPMDYGTEKAPKRQVSKKRKSCLLAACALGLALAGSPAMAENDYGPFVKEPTKKTEQTAKADKQERQKQNPEDQAQVTEEKPKLVLASFTKASVPTMPKVRYPSLFGSNETRYTDLSPFTKWSGVLQRFRNDFKKTADSKITLRWFNFLGAAAELDREDQIKAVNTYMNRFKFIADKDNYSTSDYWATPMQFMARGGDCEDYAIAKYVSLRALGFDERQLRLAIVYDHEMRMPHAVLIVYEDNKAMVLDNQNPDVRQATMHRYQPFYSINQLAWWRH